ncbi:MAG: exodeoxyribonuclease VII large subunit [Parcubacteria group bacterium QH_9_35_7]|nr:MAG: exodeoxyribonuclease VII large subunit [Parcubacteria group bacterium QH_9_35_7]
MPNKVLTVSKFIKYINDALRPFSNAEVKGEVTDFSINRNKWVSFDLKDEETEQILSCFTSYSLFESQGLSGVLEDGMRVKVRGQVKVRTQGQFSIFTKNIDLEGKGTLQKAYKKLKKELREERFFVEERKRSLPDFPQKIGIITSPEARAYTDFLKVLRNKFGGIDIFLYPVHVQGEKAVEDIKRAFSYFNQKQDDLDLLVLTRGGGSLEDLKAFNSEEITRAVFSSSIPVVCGVGHQEDETLAGLAADLRASTPSNAAELIVKDREYVLNKLEASIESMETNLKNIFKNKRQSITNFFTTSSKFLDTRRSEIDKIILEYKHQINRFLQEIKDKKLQINDYRGEIKKSVKEKIELNKRQLLQQQNLLESYSPKNILNRGYSIVKSDDKIIKNSDNLKEGEEVDITLSKGRFFSKVITIK